MNQGVSDSELVDLAETEKHLLKKRSSVDFLIKIEKEEQETPQRPANDSDNDSSFKKEP
jgi:hypothetical protein